MNARFFKVLFLLTCFQGANAQKLMLEPFAGIVNYQGDVQQKFFTFDQSHTAFGFGARYSISNHISAGLSVLSGKLSGSDAQSTNLARNLSFATNIQELKVIAEYDLWDLEERRFTPYGTVGLSFFKFDPYTYRTSGEKVYLQPLGTEGQGLPDYPEKKMYKLTQAGLPFGGGLRVKITDGIFFSTELVFRKLMTDYLDDVSGNYADQYKLAAARGPVAVELAYRGNELTGGAAYPPEGEQRGNPGAKDWYYTLGAKLSFRLGGGNGFHIGRGGGRIGCPAIRY